MSEDAGSGWVERLRTHLQRARPEPVERIETHLSWVLLAGSTAYKIKKPVRLPFVDYSSLASRRDGCERELRLNRRFAPQLYLGITRITGSAEAPSLDGEGAAFDYAVRMRRFDAGALLSEQALAGTLRAADVERLATRLGALHRLAPPVRPDRGYGSVEARRQAPQAALDALVAQAPASAARVAPLREWFARQAATLAPLWQQRLDQGWVREGHGDLHLANLVVLDDEVMAFDAIEFDAGLRSIDVVDDAAFTVMDLLAHARRSLAFRFLNGWLDETGDHAGLPLWRHALAYRAVVRALVAALHAPRAGPDLDAYLDLAGRVMEARAQPRLFVMHGLPGSGKSHVALRLAERGAIRLRSDVERKRLAGLAALADSRSVADLYGAAFTRRTYERLSELARTTLLAGCTAVVDAAFLRRDERQRFAALAGELRVPFAIVECHAPEPLLRERVARRRVRGDDASEADLGVLERLRGWVEPLDAGERGQALSIDTACGEDAVQQALDAAFPWPEGPGVDRPAPAQRRTA